MEDVIKVTIGPLVAFFLLTTGRGLKAIQLCKECLIFLDNKERRTPEIVLKPLKTLIYQTMFTAYYLIPDYKNAVKFSKDLLVLYRESGAKNEEGRVTMALAEIHRLQFKYAEAKELLERAVIIRRETGVRKDLAKSYGNLGAVCWSLSEYEKAKECHGKALAIWTEMGDREEEAICYNNLGTVFHSLGENIQAKEYYEKAIAIKMEIGDRGRGAMLYGNLGGVLTSLGEYAKAKECLERAISLTMETGDREQELTLNGKLGCLFMFLGEYVQAKEYHEKALTIALQIGHKKGQASSYGNLGDVFRSLGEYIQAKGYLERALAIRMEIGDRAGEAVDYGNLGTLFMNLGEYIKAKEFYEKALAIRRDIGDRDGEVVDYANLAAVFLFLNKHLIAEEFLDKALSICKEIGEPEQEFRVLLQWTLVKLSQGKVQEAADCLLLTINKSEHLRGFLGNNDQLKISFSDVHHSPYRRLSALFCFQNPKNAVYVLELERSRALADLMASQYSAEREISADPQSWIGIENIMKKESDCTCLYISHYARHVFLWILTASGVIHFRMKTVNECNVHAVLVQDFDDFFSKSFCNFETLPDEKCEDRSLNNVEPNRKFSLEESLPNLRLVEDKDEEYQDPEPEHLFYHKLLIAPVADLLVENEIIIVPERDLYQIPFSALRDKDGKYLSETFRIRVVPSLTTLKLIQDSPADYHSQTGALIVGDPVVGRVLYKGHVENLKPLPCARKEAEMIGRLLGVAPLLGEHATKQAVLQVIHSVSLIHFAAHGNAERGEIALSPVRSTNRIPEEEEYLLTMSEISQVQLRAKLVVLSCCHSGSGQIRAEGVIGIARAFLGSGARSVLVALWALEDSATEQLMRHFYEHLARGESASESLHEAMKWMRCNGYSDVRQWAPFMLIGDNVKFDIEKIRVSSTYHINLCSLKLRFVFVSENRVFLCVYACMLPTRGGWANPNLRLCPTHHGVPCLKFNALPN